MRDIGKGGAAGSDGAVRASAPRASAKAKRSYCRAIAAG
jgi:hypothetical protein